MLASVLIPSLIALPSLAASTVQERPPRERPPQGGPAEESGPTGLLLREGEGGQGYTLFGPLSSRDTVLVDAAGEIVHRWTSEYNAGQAVYLLDDGSLLRGGVDRGTREFSAGGAGGRVERFSWDGSLEWSYLCSDEQRRSHHDIEPLPGGNVLLLAWEKKTREEAIAMGRDPDAAEDGLWPDTILEIEPILPEGGKVVWEWHVWDHLIQDRDPDKPNFGVVSEHPERIDINVGRPRPMSEEEKAALRALGYLQDEPEPAEEGGERGGRGGRGGRRGGRADWNHTNSVSYDPGSEQIVISVKALNEIFVLDHSTSTEEAAGSTGGRWGKGGDLLYRWGNPANYQREGEQQLNGQHNAHWIDAGLEGAGNILVYDNNAGGDGRDRWSRVVEIAPPRGEDGAYQLGEEEAFGPEQPTWSYGGPEQREFYSSVVSGSQRLPGGNTLITTGTPGQMLEVTRAGEVVWEYVNPIVSEPGAADERGGPPGGEGPGGAGGRGGPPGGVGGPPPGRGGRGGGPGRGPGGMARTVFRAIRYPADHPGLQGLQR